MIASVAADVSHLQGYNYQPAGQGYDYPKPDIPFELPTQPAPTYLPPDTSKICLPFQRIPENKFSYLFKLQDRLDHHLRHHSPLICLQKQRKLNIFHIRVYQGFDHTLRN